MRATTSAQRSRRMARSPVGAGEATAGAAGADAAASDAVAVVVAGEATLAGIGFGAGFLDGGLGAATGGVGASVGAAGPGVARVELEAFDLAGFSDAGTGTAAAPAGALAVAGRLAGAGTLAGTGTPARTASPSGKSASSSWRRSPPTPARLGSIAASLRAAAARAVTGCCVPAAPT